MNIVVCMKRVPDTASMSRLKLGPSGMDIEKTLLGFKTNEWDDYALEEAVQIRKKVGGRITALTVGPATCDDMLRKAIALGADTAIRIDEDMTFDDSFMVAQTMMALLRTMSIDMLLFGMQSEDLGMASLGVMVAEMLGMTHAAGVVKVEPGPGQLKVWRELEGGAREIYSLRLPAVLTIQTGINHPRYPSYLNIKKAKERELKVIRLSDLGMERTELREMVRLERLEFPQLGKRGEIIAGSPKETTVKLSHIIEELGVL